MKGELYSEGCKGAATGDFGGGYAAGSKLFFASHGGCAGGRWSSELSVVNLVGERSHPLPGFGDRETHARMDLLPRSFIINKGRARYICSPCSSSG